MNYEEFSIALGGGWYDDVEVACHNSDCENVQFCKKGTALNNFKRNGKFLCRSCAYTPEGKRKIAKATSYKRSKATRKKMSNSAKAKYKTEWGIAQKKRLSRLAAKQHTNQSMEKFRVRGVYPSKKAKQPVAYNSSYELLRCWMLDRDKQVKTYQTQVYYEIEERGRCLDFLIEYKDGRIKVEEVKPKDRLTEKVQKDQIRDSRKNAAKNGWSFQVITEKHLLGMTCREITAWAMEYRKQFDGIDLTEHYKERDRAKSKKYQDAHYDDLRVVVWCEFCDEMHTIRRWSHQQNIARNGRYICHAESATKSKNIRVNPYAKRGMKQCSKCERILPFNGFWKSKTHSSGYLSQCIECKRGLTDVSRHSEPDARLPI